MILIYSSLDPCDVVFPLPSPVSCHFHYPSFFCGIATNLSTCHPPLPPTPTLPLTFPSSSSSHTSFISHLLKSLVSILIPSIYTPFLQPLIAGLFVTSLIFGPVMLSVLVPVVLCLLPRPLISLQQPLPTSVSAFGPQQTSIFLTFT